MEIYLQEGHFPTVEPPDAAAGASRRLDLMKVKMECEIPRNENFPTSSGHEIAEFELRNTG